MNGIPFGNGFRSALRPALLAAAMALSAAVAVAQKSGGGDNGETSTRSVACSTIGCGNGSRVCGTVTWSQWIWIPTPWVYIPWVYSETDTCYESPEY